MTSYKYSCSGSAALAGVEVESSVLIQCPETESISSAMDHTILAITLIAHEQPPVESAQCLVEWRRYSLRVYASY
jgi:hypothetical protein